jgi:hypothetical protein
MSKVCVAGFGLSLDVSVPGSSRASVIHSVAAVALAIAIVGVAGVSRATDEQFGNYFYCICRLPFARSHWIGTRNCQFGWLRGVDLNHRPLAYEFRGKLQIQILCGADDNPRGRMNTGD